MSDGELCPWCEGDNTTETLETQGLDSGFAERIDKALAALSISLSYSRGYMEEHKCKTCGAVWRSGGISADFSVITTKGKPALSVDVHPCEQGGPCRHSEQYANNGWPCNLCSRNETQIYGKDHNQHGDHHEARPAFEGSPTKLLFGVDGAQDAEPDT